MIKCNFAGCNGATCMGFCGASTGELPECDLLGRKVARSLADGAKTKPSSIEYVPPIPQGPTALNSQIGGAHYKELPIQPVEYIHKNNIPFIEGAVIKYVTRWRVKGGVKDLEKAKHFIDLLIELEGLNA